MSNDVATAVRLLTRIKKHLLKQKKRAEHPDTGSCQYRSPNGLRCAVGCLVPKVNYDPKSEGATLFDVPNGSIKRGKWSGHNSGTVALAKMLNKSHIPANSTVWKALSAAQIIHDTSQPRLWAREMDDLIAETKGASK